ncbi:hypothetical protein [Micromonospora sp. WMMD1082]|uniref:hypothetical protein n=1 Tax=Micromonospora sp. WMMD1082 TaxID=3016104 RepID=UPI002417795B|nr:hypothetical protein [Micromonospora sp. WMMD1082]MDG4792721.1 hypothetical protein [Micromonospora sp. WMMD1082]
MSDTPRDWRGTEIAPGALVVYGATVGRSVELVEARVSDPMLSPSGRIWLDVIRRSYTGSGRDRVHVGADRLTVVSALPTTSKLTAAEVRAARDRRYAEWAANRETHDLPAFISADDKCARCGLTWRAASDRRCSE